MDGKLKFFLVTLYIVGFGWLLRTITVGKNLGILDPKGIIASQERDLIFIAVLLMLIVVIPVVVMAITFSWRYREGNTKAEYRPDEDSDPVKEFIWWAVPCTIILILGTITYRSTHQLDPYRAIESNVAPITIQVVSLDWKWLFIYPKQGIATVGYVEFPENTPINFEITSDAPMNSFWIPQLAGQLYAMAGMNSELHVLANEIGVYPGVSSNFSGDGFTGMKFNARVVSRGDFDKWVAETQLSPSMLLEDEYKRLSAPSKNEPEAVYGMVKPGLYGDIIMKYMEPAKKKEEIPVTTMEMSSTTVISTTTEKINQKSGLIMQM